MWVGNEEEQDTKGFVGNLEKFKSRTQKFQIIKSFRVSLLLQKKIRDGTLNFKL